MKFVEKAHGGMMHRVELSERNLRVLLAKLQDPDSQRTLLDPDYKIMVVAVPDSEHYSDRPAGPMVHEPITDEELGR